MHLKNAYKMINLAVLSVGFTMADKKNLQQLFFRPQEPVFMPKGDDNVSFEVPMSYLAPRYQSIGPQLVSRWGREAEKKIPVSEISLPELGDILNLKRQENFTLFVPKHRELAGKLIDIFLGMRNVDELQSMAVFARDRVNPYLFNYCLSVAILHRPDTQDLDIPTFIQTFPDKYIDAKVFQRAREQATIVPAPSRIPIEIPKDFSASDLEPEHRVAYFREDLGINLHHWHWHLVYPFQAARAVVDKNRRGELFYYMHQQIIARYNNARLCNNLNRVVRFLNWREPIAEAYFPKLDSFLSSRGWPPRVANQTIKDLNREDDGIHRDVDELTRWRDRIYAAIHQGYAENEAGRRIPLTENEGIDVLGNMVEASILSPNRNVYGDLHNLGHNFISFIHDPDHRNLEEASVMGDSATAMRDPVFYRWHAFIDDIFQEFKATIPRYDVARLNYPGITVSAIQVSSQKEPANQLNTFWQQSDIDLSRGMDFQPRGSVFARFTHLQHQPFTYRISVNNAGSGQVQGTCRIFIAPKLDEKGNPWLFRDQKGMFIELDRFVVTLRKGDNTITRRSIDSSVTIPFERTFRNLDSTPQGGEALTKFNFCGCGWPHHMLIPKGTPQGHPCHLFVMISNYEDDKVQQSIEGTCNDAESYCGIKDKLYPDRRSMGYPFDRMPRTGVETLQQFLTPNMRVQEVTIRFRDTKQ